MAEDNALLAGTSIDLIHGCCQSFGNQFLVEISPHVTLHACIWRHLAEELVHRAFILRKLGALIKDRFPLFPAANTKLGVPTLIQGLVTDDAWD